MEAFKTRYADDISRFSSAGLIIRQKEPKNLEAPFDRIDSYLTPNELFYIRSHFPIPNLDRASYQLRIDGAVRRPFALSYEELRSMRSEPESPPWSAQVIVESFSSRRCKEHSGNSEQSAMRNGRVCPLEHCWSLPKCGKMHARSCSKERIAEHPRKNPFLPPRSHMFGVCPEPRQFSRKS